VPGELLQGSDMSGYGAGYGDGGVTGYEDPNAVTGYGSAMGEARLVLMHFPILLMSLSFASTDVCVKGQCPFYQESSCERTRPGSSLI